MEVHFTPELQAKVNAVAAETDGPADTYVQHLVANYIEHDSWFRKKVGASLNRLDRGEFIAHDEVGARLRELLATE